VIRWLALRAVRRVLLSIDATSGVLGLAEIDGGRHAAAGFAGVSGAVLAAVAVLLLVRPGPRPGRSR
jgi:hypothetical protein